MKVFLDTNVLVSAVATRGLCADVLREVLVSHQLVISAPLIEELKGVLGEKLDLPYDLISEFVEILKQNATLSTPTALPSIDIQDKDDLTILSSASSGEADLFITGDKELLELKNPGGMEIVSPRAFWEILKAQPPHEP
ncbi:MAG TPA: putative toxin-antitoxin system toxin component, PIN family [Syntrophaceae bacterium]|nr:putative toxin-antitoxin system toxin component, PIN family [Syntrophaceae bacterium]